jgi:hypothetical protein
LRARSLKSWNMIPMVLRYFRSSHFESFVISRPASSYISHFFGRIAPIIDLMMLVFPLPDAPMRNTNSPDSISRSISRRTLRSRYERVTCENCMRKKVENNRIQNRLSWENCQCEALFRLAELPIDDSYLHCMYPI